MSRRLSDHLSTQVLRLPLVPSPGWQRAGLLSHHARIFSEAPAMNSRTDGQAMNVIIAIESSLVRLDVKDTLRDLGIDRVRVAATASLALAALDMAPCDVAILGFESCNQNWSQLIGALVHRHIPTVILGSGAGLGDSAPTPSNVESLSVPFDSPSLSDAITRAIRSRLSRSETG